MKDIAELLDEIELLRGLEPGQRELVAGCGRNQAFVDGERLLTVGDSAAGFFAIRRGSVAIELQPAAGPPLLIETLDAGDVVGFSWLFEPYLTEFDVRARGDVGVIAFDGTCLRGKCDADHDLGYELMRRFARVMTHRLQMTRLRLLDLYGAGGAER